MSIAPLGLAAVAGCSLAFAVLDLQRKQLAATLPALALVVALMLGGVPFFTAWLAVTGLPSIGGGYWLPATGSILLNSVAGFAFLDSVRRAPLSTTIPVLGLTPVFTAAVGALLLAELPDGRQVLGIVLVAAGVVWLSLPERSGPAPEAGRRRLIGALLMLVVALTWSVAGPLDKLAIRESSPAWHGLVLSLGVGFVSLLVLAAIGRLRDLLALRSRVGLLVAAVLTGTLGMVLQLFALTLVWASFVETLKRALGSLLALVSGALFFGERVDGRRVAAVLLTVVGVVLIAG